MTTPRQSRGGTIALTMVAAVLAVGLAGLLANHYGLVRLPAWSVDDSLVSDLTEALKPIVGDRLTAVEKKAEAAEAAVKIANEAKATAEAANAAIAAVAAKVESMAAAVDTFVTKANTTFATKEDVALAVRQADNAIAGVAKLDDRLTAIDAKVAEHEARLTDLESRHDRLERQVAIVDAVCGCVKQPEPAKPPPVVKVSKPPPKKVVPSGTCTIRVSVIERNGAAFHRSVKLRVKGWGGRLGSYERTVTVPGGSSAISVPCEFAYAADGEICLLEADFAIKLRGGWLSTARRAFESGNSVLNPSIQIQFKA